MQGWGQPGMQSGAAPGFAWESTSQPCLGAPRQQLVHQNQGFQSRSVGNNYPPSPGPGQMGRMSIGNDHNQHQMNSFRPVGGNSISSGPPSIPASPRDKRRSTSKSPTSTRRSSEVDSITGSSQYYMSRQQRPTSRNSTESHQSNRHSIEGSSQHYMPNQPIPSSRNSIASGRTSASSSRNSRRASGVNSTEGSSQYSQGYTSKQKRSTMESTPQSTGARRKSTRSPPAGGSRRSRVSGADSVSTLSTKQSAPVRFAPPPGPPAGKCRSKTTKDIQRNSISMSA